MIGTLASTTSVTERTAAHPHELSDVLDELSCSVNRQSALEGVKLGVLMNAVGRRSYGPLLLILGIFAISPATVLPFMTSVVAAITLLVALQMVVGLKRPWLPKQLLEVTVPRRAFFVFLDRARPALDRLEGDLLRPRWMFLTKPFCVNIVALCVVVAALVTFPLSLIPFAPLAPGLAIVLFGLGMTVRDGVWLAIGIALTIAGLVLALPLVL